MPAEGNTCRKAAWSRRLSSICFVRMATNLSDCPNNMRVYANIDMDSDNGLGFRMQSDKNDSISLQNMNVELSRFQLGELSEVLPYMPRLTGLFSAEAVITSRLS